MATGLTADPAAVLAEVARVSRGRLLAALAAPTRDIALAEDALGDAFERALLHWTEEGVPANPEGWLLRVGRNRLLDLLGAAGRRTAVPLELADRVPAPDPPPGDDLPDLRLAMLFACAHPAIDAGVRTPLVLQVVFSADASTIATAFAVPGPTMAQRLVRAKRRIRDTGVRFAIPERTRLPERVPAVLEALYGAYSLSMPQTDRGEVESRAGEAVHLAVLLADVMPDEPEVLGLAALLCLSFARAPARDPDRFVPLDEQDPARWSPGLIRQGEALLRRAAALRRPGRFQLEAAIESVHDDRARTGRTELAALRRLDDELAIVAPTLGSHVARAAVIGSSDGADAGLAALTDIEDARIEAFQPAWATRAHLLGASDRPEEARTVYARAISLTVDPLLRSWLEARSAELPRGEVSRTGDRLRQRGKIAERFHDPERTP